MLGRPYGTILVTKFQEILEAGVLVGAFPGAVFLGAGRGGDLLEGAAGNLGSEPPFLRAATVATVYDLASLTKLYTLAAYLHAAGQHKVGPRTPVRDFFPLFPPEIEVGHLLTHSAGLGLELQRLENVEASLWLAALARAPLQFAPGSRVLYSCSNYFVLARLVEILSGTSLDAYWQKHLLRPLGLRETNTVPPALDRVAPTEACLTEACPTGGFFHGVVHDEAARSWQAQTGTCAGNAGLFSNAAEVAAFARIWMPEGPQLLHPRDVKLALTAHMPENSYWRGWAWQLNAGFYMTDSAPPGTAGHLGFTGPSLVINPASGHMAVTLCNRVHPTRHGPDRLPYLRQLHQCLFTLR